jgi:hypothetical protein
LWVGEKETLPGTPHSRISSGQRNCALWEPQPQKSVALRLQPEDGTTKSIWTCGGIGGGESCTNVKVKVAFSGFIRHWGFCASLAPRNFLPSPLEALRISQTQRTLLAKKGTNGIWAAISQFSKRAGKWNRLIYFPSEGRHAVDFSSRKNPTASVGSEPAILGTRGQPLDHRSR